MAKIPQDSIAVKCWLFEHSYHAIIHTCNRVILIICIHACMLNIRIRWQLNDDQRQQKKQQAAAKMAQNQKSNFNGVVSIVTEVCAL